MLDIDTNRRRSFAARPADVACCQPGQFNRGP